MMTTCSQSYRNDLAHVSVEPLGELVGTSLKLPWWLPARQLLPQMDRVLLELADTHVGVRINNSLLCNTEPFPARIREHFHEFGTVRLVPRGEARTCQRAGMRCEWGIESLFESSHLANSSVSHFALSIVCSGKSAGFLTWTAVSPGGIDGRGTSQSMANSNRFITVILWTVSGQLLKRMTSPLSRSCLWPEKHLHVRRFPSNVADSILTSFALFSVSVGHNEIVTKVHKHPAEHIADVYGNEADPFVECSSLFSQWDSSRAHFYPFPAKFLKSLQFSRALSNMLSFCPLVLPQFVMFSLTTCLKWNFVCFSCLSVWGVLAWNDIFKVLWRRGSMISHEKLSWNTLSSPSTVTVSTFFPKTIRRKNGTTFSFFFQINNQHNDRRDDRHDILRLEGMPQQRWRKQEIRSRWENPQIFSKTKSDANNYSVSIGTTSLPHTKWLPGISNWQKLGLGKNLVLTLV